ncbi:hypothetical protein EWW49_17620 [Pseudomonas syringae]|uniref:hypothetical protein n=1 Tax=Pseudomonas TaxID=286 RepID=UPI001100FC94|nr:MULTISPECIES: hypothetical protein [Pseudomonas]MCK9717631.1 hypothetical protein [Pseudomonas syringae pv. syringae]MCK9761262.1 hypothetical protein [Pseudomonas syringae pv. syringae]NAO26227.1 hypothetical protein [Pseudomonas syringae pv. dysoxyli]TFZ36066.1 hypothetical protein EWW49_17620 [Pseudomonas syringae]
MSQKNDQVFSLSISEIWMVIAFLLLMLTGYQVYKLNSDKHDLQQKLDNFHGLDQREKAIAEATQALKARLAEMGITNSDEVISKLVDASKARDEASELKVLLTQKEQEVTALAAIDKALKDAGAAGKPEQSKRLILETLMSYDQLKKLVADPEKDQQPTDIVKRIGELKATEQMLQAALSIDGAPTSDQVQELVKHAQAFTQAEKDGVNPALLQKTNSDLKGQVQFLQNRLNKGKGGDLPPCWADSAGKPEMFLTVYLRDNDMSFEPAWPSSRLADAQALPGFAELMANPTRSYEDFVKAVQGIRALGEKNECRYFVRLSSQIQGAVMSDRRRFQIESVFYKLEVRR